MHSEPNCFFHPTSIERSALTFLFALAALLITPAITTLLLRRTGAVRQNFRGERIPAMFGLSIVISSILLLSICQGRILTAPDAVPNWIVLMLCYGTLGFFDDRWGEKQIKGLKGHLTAALVEYRITSGLVKAIGGVIGGLFIGYRIDPSNPARVVAAGLLIALCANGLNLLDLRPGRACAVFLFCSTCLLAGALSTAAPYTGELLLVCVVLPTLPAWILDSRAKVMLGDTGSNVLGASLGLAVVESRSLVLQVVTIAILIALHIVAERRSITEILAKNKVLNALDKMSGLRE